MKTKKGDFIEIDFVGKVKDSNQIFDLTLEKVAKENNIHNPKQTYKPVIICLGQNEIIKGLDEELTDKEINKQLTLEIPTERAFGKKNPKLMKLISANKFKKEKITPFPGLQLNLDGMIGTVRAVSGGRIIVDFNHPLAGKNLIYEVKINKIVKDTKEKLKSLLKTDKITIKDNEAKADIQIPEPIQKEIEKQIKKLIPELKKITFTKPTKKDN